MANKPADGITIGLISDTHGLLRPEAIQALNGVQRIIHAGDIGGPEILEALRAIAPVDAVRGNNDKGPWASSIPIDVSFESQGVWIHAIHDIKELSIDPATAGFGVVIAGHSHKPGISERNGVLFVNPGSAGPRRFNLPVAIAYLHVSRGSASAKIRDIL